MYPSCCVQLMQPLNVVEMFETSKYSHPLPEITLGTALRTAKCAAGLIVYIIWAASSGSYRDDGVCPPCWGIKSFRREAEPGASPAGFTQATAPVMTGSGENARDSHEVLSFVHAFFPDDRLGEPRNSKTQIKNQTETHRGAPAALPPAPQTRSCGFRCSEPGGPETLVAGGRSAGGRTERCGALRERRRRTARGSPRCGPRGGRPPPAFVCQG